MRACVLVAIAVLAGHSVAQGAPLGYLSFRDPIGVVGPTESIEVWMQLTLDPASSPIDMDPSLPNRGIDPSDVPGDWYSLDRAVLTDSIGCSGTFITESCTGGPYTFVHYAGPGQMYERESLNLLPGESFDFLIGSFVPSGGAVQVGTYTFDDAYLGMLLVGSKPSPQQPLLDEFGEQVYDEYGPVYVPLKEVDLPTVFYSVVTSNWNLATRGSSTFQRTVVPLSVVPVPPAAGLFVAALVALGGARRSDRIAGERYPATKVKPRNLPHREKPSDSSTLSARTRSPTTRVRFPRCEKARNVGTFLPDPPKP